MRASEYGACGTWKCAGIELGIATPGTLVDPPVCDGNAGG